MIAYTIAQMAPGRKRTQRQPKIDDYLAHNFHELIPKEEKEGRRRKEVQTVKEQMAMAQFITRMAQNMMAPAGNNGNGDPS